MRVLEWMLRRIDGQAGGVEHAFGVSPRFEDLRWDGLGFDTAAFDSVMHLDPAAWTAELASHDALFAQLGDRLPAQLPATRQAIGARMGSTQSA